MDHSECHRTNTRYRPQPNSPPPPVTPLNTTQIHTVKHHSDIIPINNRDILSKYPMSQKNTMSLIYLLQISQTTSSNTTLWLCLESAKVHHSRHCITTYQHTVSHNALKGQCHHHLFNPRSVHELMHEQIFILL